MDNETEFCRTEMLFGREALEALRRVRVAVFGVGGVGGYVVEALARSGVGALDLFDKDTVSVSNVNRQLCALHSTIGRPKVEVVAERVRDINPACAVCAHTMFYMPDNADDVDLGAFDYVADCIDTVTAKVELARRCHALRVPLVSSMGAANKMDPTAFRVVDITKTAMDPIAKIMRKKLRHMGIPHLKVVYSEERPIKPIVSANSPEGLSDAAVATGGSLVGPRRPVPASNAFVPATAGLVLGGEIVRDIIGCTGT